jgi:hypothetical protein
MELLPLKQTIIHNDLEYAVQHVTVKIGTWERALVTRKVIDPRVSIVLKLF